MDEHTSWHPSEDEVRHIREELGPLLSRLARRDATALDGERWRQLLPVC